MHDLEIDPGELDDVARDPAYQAERIECLERLLNWRIEHEERTLAGHAPHVERAWSWVATGPADAWSLEVPARGLC